METQTIGGLIRRKLSATGESQRSFADRLGLSPSHLSAIVQGDIKLPNADARRRLARELGLSHIQLLVLLGELTEGEAGTTVPEPEEGDRAELIAKLREVELTPERYESFREALNIALKYDSQRVVGAAGERAAGGHDRASALRNAGLWYGAIEPRTP